MVSIIEASLAFIAVWVVSRVVKFNSNLKHLFLGCGSSPWIQSSISTAFSYRSHTPILKEMESRSDVYVGLEEVS
ncbi:hypothetical protein SERLA73DRAFT_122665 [Serpula lacrymans var. lacrymans S7.3]|uniref:Uncharacterized protein n=2 Tax=Serpula lacrymans var. lacrymans TaxID=341189 RepID=F8PY29_SERL3|nr:uncharacterized protein SERLADRAFT_369620 [Serpula lacrymans var. lacrymans S7.9]EGN98792.1 hypothetical protein SERLA73DRAFT_122665 [Serpula lacrymans var. lacrymans S7.3]EGO24386.1 hypothetical protein SERLADRAFT_369620 [Serpula lacrymans var. lacrymans S7.9]